MMEENVAFTNLFVQAGDFGSKTQRARHERLKFQVGPQGLLGQ